METVKFICQYESKKIELVGSVQRTLESKLWVIFLHGLQANRAIYGSYFLDPRFSRYNLLSLDFVGFGESDRPLDFPYDLRDQLDLVYQVFQQLNVQEVCVVGHSLGGMVATLMLEKPLEFLKAIVSLEGNMIGADCGESVLVIKKSLPEFVSGYDQFKEKIKALRKVDYIEKTSAQAFYLTALSIVEWSNSEKLLGYFVGSEIPTLFIGGEKSQFQSSPRGMVEIPGSGHFMLVDAEEVTRKVVGDFLEGCQAPLV